MSKRGLFCGSFDPFTYGHLDVVNKALEKVDELIINVGYNEAKIQEFSSEKRVEMIIKALKCHPRRHKIIVVSEHGMTIDIALLYDVNVLIRGVRQGSDDVAQEQTLAAINKNLALSRGLELETEFIIQDGEMLKSISSSAVKFLCENHEFITAFKYVPANVAEVLAETYLKPLWDEVCVNNSAKSNAFWQELVSAYKGRAYHNLTHIAYMMNMLKIYSAYTKKTFDDIRKELLLAILIHDIVYEPGAFYEDNEKASAQFVDKIRKVLPYDINVDLVKNMVLSTAINYDKGGMTIIRDLDFSILGTFDVYTWHEYCRKIRAEYSTFSDEEFYANRLEFLQKLATKQIFKTDFFFNNFEDKAKKNIKKEIECLQKN